MNQAEKREVLMTGENRKRENNGPDYFNEPIFQSMAVLLRRRGIAEESVYKGIVTANRIWKIAKEKLGIETLQEVDEDVIRRLLEILIEDIRPTVAKGYLAMFGTLVLANTGHNPYTGTLVALCKQDPDTILEGFISSCRFSEQLRPYVVDMRRRGLKENTVYDNIAVAVRGLNFLDGLIGTDYTLENLGLDEMMAIRMNLQVSERTCKRYIEIIRRFVRFATGRDPLRANLMWNVSDDYAPNRKFITVEQWKLLTQNTDPTTFLMLCLGGAMGLRRAEIANILLEDIRGDRLTIRGKGHGPNGKMVEVVMPGVVIKALMDYLPYRQSVIDNYGDNSEGHLFIQTWKKIGCPVKPDGVYRRIRTVADEHGIDMSSHSLRRLFATVMHDAGTDDDTLRRMMRHTNIQTTMMCYLNADPRRMACASEKVESVLFE